jgi:hypothetical protein
MSSTRSSSNLATPGFLALLLLFPPWAAAADPAVDVQLDRSQVQLGQPVVAIILVHNAQNLPEVSAPEAVDCKISRYGRIVYPTPQTGLSGKPGAGPAGIASDQKLFDAINKLQQKMGGDLLKQLDQLQAGDADAMREMQAALARNAPVPDHGFRYLIEPDKAGILSVAGFKVTVDGKELTTEPFTINVQETRPQSTVRVQVALADPHPWLGEETRLLVDILVPRTKTVLGGKSYPYLPFKDVHINLSVLEQDARFELVKPLDALVRESVAPPGQRGFQINAIVKEMTLGSEPAGVPAELGWYRRRLSIPVRLREGGTIPLPQVTISGDIVPPLQASSARSSQD